ncbi:MAG: mannonate dehydratase [Terriglobia bacterium]
MNASSRVASRSSLNASNVAAVCRYFGSRDRINHMHFRNVRVQTPREKYTEVFLDEGQVDLFAVMKELVREK